MDDRTLYFRITIETKTKDTETKIIIDKRLYESIPSRNLFDADDIKKDLTNALHILKGKYQTFTIETYYRTRYDSPVTYLEGIRIINRPDNTIEYSDFIKKPNPPFTGAFDNWGGITAKQAKDLINKSIENFTKIANKQFLSFYQEKLN